MSKRDISLVRHKAKCGICAHPQLQEIEQEFVNWTSPTKIASEFGVSRDAVYRHSWATGLAAKRQTNIRSALEKIIEQAGDVEANANAVVAAIGAWPSKRPSAAIPSRPQLQDVVLVLNCAEGKGQWSPS